jgi:hypothetical protein
VYCLHRNVVLLVDKYFSFLMDGEIFLYIWIFLVFLHFLVKGNRGGGRAEEWVATRGGAP